jgi:hypothetical protein
MPKPFRENEIIAKQIKTQSLSIEGTVLSGGVLLGTGQFVDLNGEADGLVIDADADTTISAPTDDQIDFELKSVDHVVMKAVAVADAAATTNIVEIAFTSPVDTTGTNVHNALNIDIEIGNASGGTNSVNAIAIDNITGDAQVVETGILLGTGFDVGIDMQGTKIDLDAAGTSSISAAVDNTIDIEINGAVDFTLTANTLTAVSGSTIATNTIAETTAASGVTVDGVLLKDSTVTGTHIGGQQDTCVVITGDGAITIAPSSVFLSKGSAAAITLAAPTSVTHDGYIIRIVATSAFAHVITSGVDGFNAKGSSGTITLGGAIGDSATLIAKAGHWYTLGKVNATVA